MKIDALVAEIGSTTTVVNAFTGLSGNHPEWVGQGMALTSVSAGDVNIGLSQAIADLKTKLGNDLEITEIFASSSAAGGLRMTVHGLVYDMTVKAAKEAALGAGANIHLITAGMLQETDVKRILKIRPNIIMIAGGTDYGERETSLANAKTIARLKLDIPVIYAGNMAAAGQIEDIFAAFEQEKYLKITENVYPKIDELNVEPVRKAIQAVFEKHIVEAKGMNEVRKIINEAIIPTPLAVMLSAKLLEEEIGDLLVFDVGGATTDVHSVTNGSDEIVQILINPEPKAKRTVEGDLGVYVNRNNLIDLIGIDTLALDTGIPLNELRNLLDTYPAIPEGNAVTLIKRLTKEALRIALERHAGKIRNLYGAQGRMRLAEGKDLTKVKYVIGTGGALTKLSGGKLLLRETVANARPELLIPRTSTQVLIDEDYIMASCGVLSLKYPRAALKLLCNSLKIEQVISCIRKS